MPSAADAAAKEEDDEVLPGFPDGPTMSQAYAALAAKEDDLLPRLTDLDTDSDVLSKAMASAASARRATRRRPTRAVARRLSGPAVRRPELGADGLASPHNSTHHASHALWPRVMPPAAHPGIL